MRPSPLVPTTTDDDVAAPPAFPLPARDRNAVLAIFALSVGGFPIGTTEFVTTGLLLVLTAAYAAANLATALAPSYVSLAGARFFAGLPHGAYFGVG